VTPVVRADPILAGFFNNLDIKVRLDKPFSDSKAIGKEELHAAKQL
jgi:hypothetical protein